MKGRLITTAGPPPISPIYFDWMLKVIETVFPQGGDSMLVLSRSLPEDCLEGNSSEEAMSLQNLPPLAPHQPISFEHPQAPSLCFVRWFSERKVLRCVYVPSIREWLERNGHVVIRDVDDAAAARVSKAVSPVGVRDRRLSGIRVSYAQCLSSFPLCKWCQLAFTSEESRDLCPARATCAAYKRSVDGHISKTDVFRFFGAVLKASTIKLS
ncbi:hypothetical protein E1301_Tti002886 [Triplophysa tibetana]|uniref:Uncharacterized protein n=1 Tax=Triplophysa tibetana TaxID=1572043 RepID=A0A5A9NQ31_9TELE|nr:hypothetical protein E1301_Tti002886 [Triplophysa tibetana]